MADGSAVAGDDVLNLFDDTREKICFLIHFTQCGQLFSQKLVVENWGPTLRNNVHEKVEGQATLFLINISTFRSVKLKNKVGAQLSHPTFFCHKERLSNSSLLEAKFSCLQTIAVSKFCFCYVFFFAVSNFSICKFC